MALRLRSATRSLEFAAALDVTGQVLALGLAAVAAGIVWRRTARSGRVRWLAVVAGAWLLATTALHGDLAGLLHWSPTWVRPWLIDLAAAIAGTAVAALAAMVAARLGGRWLGLVCLVIGAGAVLIDAILSPLSYPGLHLVGVLAAGAVAARGMGWASGAWRPGTRVRRAVIPLAVLAAAVALVRAPGNQELILLLREPAAVLAPFLAELRPALASSGRIPEAQRSWFEDRSAVAPIPPSSPPLVRSPVVIMVGVDSLRFDLLTDPRREADLPELFRLRKESTFFARARAPGSSTAPCLSAIFSGLYYSQLYWRMVPGAGPDVYPDEDPTPRFPELLDAAGVPTATVDAVGFLLNRFGVVRGFREEQSLRNGGGRYAGSHDVMSAAIARLERQGDEPLFLFLHLIDAHAPYDRAGKRATEFESYVAELGLVDRELGRLRETIARLPFADRTILIVFSDHGEAFGEHGTTFHGITLYDELLRVPLMIRPPGAPHPVDVTEPVSLIDLGPTVLDLLGVATPGRFMGQSLVPYLRGEHPRLTRPLVAEARLMRSLVTPKGMKIIHDTRAQTVEVFDLRRDPQEKTNLFGNDTDDLLGVVRAFFQVHTLRRPGYEVPYRKW